jgi:hypothetical protein
MLRFRLTYFHTTLLVLSKNLTNTKRGLNLPHHLYNSSQKTQQIVKRRLNLQNSKKSRLNSTYNPRGTGGDKMGTGITDWLSTAAKTGVPGL